MTAIYQQARPITFAQVIGQDHVKDVLKLALSKNRIGHAYLFSGPRGVGKTTTARLLAMAVNCERAHETTPPCGECESCMAVRQASHPDVIELDAASNNSVDDIRELREKVNLSAIRGGKRVWILDEAHMLTKSAANALLKTLEEPPSNLVFILATTEPEKLPPTILSRCQHFRFRRLSDAEIESKLVHLCELAGVEAEASALSLVARAADGAMRDAESLLERLLVSGQAITYQDAETALGLPPQERLQTLAKALVEGQLNALFEAAAELYRAGFAPRSLAERLIMTLRDALYANLGMDGYSFRLPLDEPTMLRLIHALDDETERFVRYNDLFSLEVALIKGHNALIGNVPSEAVFVGDTAAHVVQNAPTPQPQPSNALPDFNPHADPQNGAPSAKPQASRPQPTKSQAPKPQSSPSRQMPAPPSTPSASPQGNREQATRTNVPANLNWNTIQAKAGVRLKAFIKPAEAEIDGSKLTLIFDDRHKFHFEQLKKYGESLAELVTGLYGETSIDIRGPGQALRLSAPAASSESSVQPKKM
ncbi:MAG: DNA polymerase III subunit gamma/tau [Deinococcota bacterium]